MPSRKRAGRCAGAEAVDKLHQHTGFRIQRGAGGGCLFHHGGVLLGHLVHLIDGRVDLAEAHGLLGRRGRDLVNQAVDLKTCVAMLANASPALLTRPTPSLT